MPGYGGSDSFENYSATNVLESLTEFVIAIRAKYGVDTEAGPRQKKLTIVAHDWGCVISMRLAAEAPQLADRFILTNGPLVCSLKAFICVLLVLMKLASTLYLQRSSSDFHVGQDG